MNEFILEYGFIPAGAIIFLFVFFWLSIPFYLRECAKTEMLINRIASGDTVTHQDLDNVSLQDGQIGFAFGKLPNVHTHPEHFKSSIFRIHIIEQRELRKQYFRFIAILGLLLILLIACRVYIVEFEKMNSIENEV